MNSENIKGFIYTKRNLPAFNIIGFTKFVKSGGELYDEVRSSDKWEGLKRLNSKEKNIYGIASMDKECPEGYYRYTMGIEKNENFLEVNEYNNQLYSFIIKESSWIIFTIDFEKEYGEFWSKNPYTMIEEMGYGFNNSLGLHIDVFGEVYNGHGMEFWMPVKEKNKAKKLRLTGLYTLRA